MPKSAVHGTPQSYAVVANIDEEVPPNIEVVESPSAATKDEIVHEAAADAESQVFTLENMQVYSGTDTSASDIGCLHGIGEDASTEHSSHCASDAPYDEDDDGVAAPDMGCLYGIDEDKACNEESDFPEEDDDDDDDYNPQHNSEQEEEEDEDNPAARVRAAAELPLNYRYQGVSNNRTVAAEPQRNGVLCPNIGKSGPKCKKNYCLFCHKPVVKVARHLEQIHPHQMDVARFLALPKNSKQRRELVEALKKRGNYVHNYDVVKDGKGTLVVERRPKVDDDADESNYRTCTRCSGMFKGSYLARHQRYFCKGTLEPKTSHRNANVRSRGANMMPTSPSASKRLREIIFPQLRDDKISEILRNDHTICLAGSKMFEKLGHKLKHHQNIRYRLRLMSRLLIKFREINMLHCNFIDILHVRNYDNLVETVKLLAGFDETTNIFSNPDTVLKIQTEINKTLDILMGKALGRDDQVTASRFSNFRTLIKLNYTTDLCHHALRSKYLHKVEKPLPDAGDLKKMKEYLNNKQDSAWAAIEKDGVNIENYDSLLKVTLIQILMFNRRRVGDVESIEVSLLKQRTNSRPQGEILKALSKSEQAFCSMMERVELIGKRGRKVPILLNRNMSRNIDFLLQHRADVGIADKPFFFTNCRTKDYVRASDVLRTFGEEAKLEHPDRFTGTGLRKHIATLSQMMDLKDNELDVLAGFMGHDIRIHREFYRLPESTVQLAKVGKLLYKLDKGKMKDLKGKSLDDIVFSEDSESAEDDDVEHEEDIPISRRITSTRGALSQGGKRTGAGSSKAANTNDADEQDDTGIPAAKRRRTYQRKVWSTEEKNVVKKHFISFIKTKSLPGKPECEDFVKKTGLKRTWTNIKDCVRNLSKKYIGVL